jgi:hypothetical protein
MAAMSRDVDPKNARLYDKRTVERNIKKGLISRKDYEKHLKTLEDVAEKGAFGAADDDDDDDDYEDEGIDEEGAPTVAPAEPPETQG